MAIFSRYAYIKDIDWREELKSYNSLSPKVLKGYWGRYGKLRGFHKFTRKHKLYK